MPDEQLELAREAYEQMAWADACMRYAALAERRDLDCDDLERAARYAVGLGMDLMHIDLPVLGDRQEPGLCFIGLGFTYAATSATITGVGRDAKRVARHIVRRRGNQATGARELATTR